MSKLDQEQRDELPDSEFAFPSEKKEPLNNAAHVRNAIARFNQVKGVSSPERDEAWKRIQRAAERFGVEMKEG
jgi:cell division protein FtsX